MAKPDTLSTLSESIVKALAYYDMFDYPLTSEEVFTNLPTNHVTHDEVRNELLSLASQSIIYKLGNYFSLQPSPVLEERRLKGNQFARHYRDIAQQKARLIHSFPFVRGVMISGSLSKGYADEKSDIDFFIITDPGRLWIARTLLVLYKRIFLLNSHKYFCVNYFIDSDHLEIDEKNLFTATELSTLIPVFGRDQHARLLKNNEWLQKYFPNFRYKASSQPDRDPVFKKILEWIFNHSFPALWERLCMKRTLARWKKIYGDLYIPADFAIAFKSNRHVSKNHPRNYQGLITARYEEKMKSVWKKLALKSVA